MISSSQAIYYGIEPNRDFMQGLGTDPSATIKTERFFIHPLRDKTPGGKYVLAETVDEFIEENFDVLTLLYYKLCDICKETGNRYVVLTVGGITCETIRGGKTVNFRHYSKE